MISGIFGFAISANYSLTSPILVNIVSIDEFTNAYGLLLLTQGVSNLIGPPFAGYLYDISLVWYYSFSLGGIFILISGLLLVILPSIKCFRINGAKNNLCPERDNDLNRRNNKVEENNHANIDLVEQIKRVDTEIILEGKQIGPATPNFKAASDTFNSVTSGNGLSGVPAIDV